MLYQKLLMGNDPYLIGFGDNKPFMAHRHPEVEVSYCVEGTYDVEIENTVYTLNAGEMVVVTPMAKHEFLNSPNISGKKVTIEVGPQFLGDFFVPFLKIKQGGIFISLNDKENKSATHILQIFEKIIALWGERDEFYSLALKGYLYDFSANLLRVLNIQTQNENSTKNLQDIEKIDFSLKLIYERYSESLDLQTVAELCGYSKSNFCKIFKSVTNETFHSVLNRYRVEMACIYLANSNEPIEQIANSTGFADTKSFCRVFKKITGITAGEYRKRL